MCFNSDVPRSQSSLNSMPPPSPWTKNRARSRGSSAPPPPYHVGPYMALTNSPSSVQMLTRLGTSQFSATHSRPSLVTVSPLAPRGSQVESLMMGCSRKRTEPCDDGIVRARLDLDVVGRVGV